MVNKLLVIHYGNFFYISYLFSIVWILYFLCVWKYIYMYAAAAESLQSCLTLCHPIDGSPPGSPIPGILQARTLEWVAISFSNAWKWKVKVRLFSLTLSDPMDCSLPGSSIHGTFQARILEWGAIAFSDIYVYIYIRFVLLFGCAGSLLLHGLSLIVVSGAFIVELGL